MADADVAALREDLDAAVRLLEQALFLRQNGERPPGAPRDDLGAETWHRWDRDAEVFLRDTDRRRLLGGLRAAGCEMAPEVVRVLDAETLLAHLRDCHPDGGE